MRLPEILRERQSTSRLHPAASEHPGRALLVASTKLTMCCISRWLVCLMLVSCPLTAEPLTSINNTLDTFHAAASRADLEEYLAQLTHDAVFLGTDGRERWQGQEFRSFVSENFSQGRGWTYTKTERHIALSPDGDSAWFDELLMHDKLGQCLVLPSIESR